MLLFWLSGIPKLQTTKYDYDAKILDSDVEQFLSKNIYHTISTSKKHCRLLKLNQL